ncbi:MAG TPA: acyl-CoA dehydrogenase family protein [Microbacteriaceae bacterium]|nr:acyl-CoA dehydrogenase family protein [Microbacteriaceae bacterium]
MSKVTSLVPPVSLPDKDLSGLRQEVREFLNQQREAGNFKPYADTWLSRWDEDFSKALAAKGWLGMTLPKEYGGHGLSFNERFVVSEELLAQGAPVAAHWIADRQIIPNLLRYGTPEQKDKYLPAIARGESYFGIGMSEPDSGSDLASVRTKATKVDGGWSITGTKVWTSGGHKAHAFIVLARSAPQDTTNRHAGLSQYLVEFAQEGVEVRPIVSMNGEHHFNEIFLTDVFVPDNMVVGEIGEGWQQVNSELSFERSGPERVLSTFPLLAATIDEINAGRLASSSNLGRLIARVTALRNMSAAIADALQHGKPADVAAAVSKVMGTTTEGDIADEIDLLVGDESGVSDEFRELLNWSIDQRPGFTIRGGTNEILRGVVARGLGLR